MSKEKEEKPIRVACPVCHGMGVRELPSGNTIDCPNRACKNGFIIKK